jgi:coenzyme F420-reducing hydrogenase alpha subunit
MKSRTIKVDYLARVEGEGSLYVKIKDNIVKDVKLKIFEAPRFFEGFLRGRKYTEAPDITARICGICPVTYQMASSQAMENACGVTVEGPIRELRRLLVCGEWLESHYLHIFMLHAPDFLGYQDAIQLAKDHPEVVQRGLQLKKLGNDICILLGGREIHPISPRVGGFYKVPEKKDLEPLRERLNWAIEEAKKTVLWTGTLPFPDYEHDYEFVCMRHPDEYPFNEGWIVSNKGLVAEINKFEDNFQEEHVEHSTSLHCIRKGHGIYHVGPLARFNLCYNMLTPTARDFAAKAGLEPVCGNPYKSIIARSVECLYALQESLRIIEDYEVPDKPFVDVPPREGVGYGVSEAPRGTCYHRYRIDDKGIILDARIIPPTSQNQGIIENDLRNFVEENINLPDDKLQWQCEQMVRNYDPCISCSCHFLNLKVDRE